jgi:hypothetical protein
MLTFYTSGGECFPLVHILPVAYEGLDRNGPPDELTLMGYVQITGLASNLTPCQLDIIRRALISTLPLPVLAIQVTVHSFTDGALVIQFIPSVEAPYVYSVDVNECVNRLRAAISHIVSSGRFLNAILTSVSVGEEPLTTVYGAISLGFVRARLTSLDLLDPATATAPTPTATGLGTSGACETPEQPVNQFQMRSIVCQDFSASNTSGATQQTDDCTFSLCYGETVTTDVCTCNSDTYLRLYDSNGRLVMSNDDGDRCGDLCSYLVYRPLTIQSGCQQYTLAQGCFSQTTCAGRAIVTAYQERLPLLGAVVVSSPVAMQGGRGAALEVKYQPNPRGR